MKRDLYYRLVSWKNGHFRKPLLLQGARQVGKTYLINEFGRKEYRHFITLNFEQDPNLRTLFGETLDPKSIIEDIGIYIGKRISSEDTLIFFDEIQAAPEAITSLKYFYEQAPEYHIIAAGSLLGVSVAKAVSFPVGKVTFMTMHPMSFLEFLRASGEELLADKVHLLEGPDPLPGLLHEKLIKYYKKYLYLGGMPEVIKNYLESDNDMMVARETQRDILEAYTRDFSKYTDKTQTVKTSELWQSIPSQLARENKKFKYSDVRKGARAAYYQPTISWLKGAGLVNPAYNVTTAQIPLSGYADHSKFKIYLFDTGLLAAMLDLSSKVILTGGELFRKYNGAFVENYVAQELTASGHDPLYYWTSKSDAEVDFLLQKDEMIYPVEVKSGTSLNLKSLKSYADKYHPEFLFRTSPRNFTRSGNFVNIPLYAISLIDRIIGKLNN